MGMPRQKKAGRAIRFNLFIFKEKIKRISTSIPHAGLVELEILIK